MKHLPQKCSVPLLYLMWILYAVVAAKMALDHDYFEAVAWLILVPLCVWLNMQYFSRISSIVGYGSVADVAATERAVGKKNVTMFASLGCPFCPIVRQRLEKLQTTMGFDFEYVDVTARPGLLIAEGIRSVPWVKVGGKSIVGNATSQELARFIEEN